MPVEGVARNGKGGALLIREGAEPLYLEGLARWPEGVEGLSVVAEGLVVAQRHVPVATVGENGEVSQGVEPGSALDAVLQAPTWRLQGAGTGIEPGPWTVRFADGNGNVTEVVRAPSASTTTWSYDPVQPAQSSSGQYSGGEAGEGTLDDAVARGLWERVRELHADPAAHTTERTLGTGRLTSITVSGTHTVVLRAGPTKGLADWVADWR